LTRGKKKLKVDWITILTGVSIALSVLVGMTEVLWKALTKKGGHGEGKDG